MHLEFLQYLIHHRKGSCCTNSIFDNFLMPGFGIYVFKKMVKFERILFLLFHSKTSFLYFLLRLNKKRHLVNYHLHNWRI